MTENLISPFSTPVDVYLSSDTGFMVLPTAPEAPEGWGSPRKDAQGQPIVPGTVGGPYPAVLIQKQKGVWKEKKSEAIQSYGNVSWWGQGTGNKRTVLSFWGPISRYFPDGFVYGSDSRHKEIYYRGKIAGIAPGPVTGACLQSIADSKFLLIAVVWIDGRERVFSREFQGGSAESILTQDQRAAMSQIYHPEKAPNGWTDHGMVEGPDYALAPTTPWFFNKSGTEAHAIRRREETFDPGTGGGSTVTEPRNELFKITVTETGVSGLRAEQNPPYAYTETVKKEDLGVWTSPADVYGDSHQWQRDVIEADLKQTGRQICACDYIDDTLVKCYLVQDHHFWLSEDFVYGVDAAEHPHPNTGQTQNNFVGTYTGEPRGGQAQTWSSTRVQSYLEWEVPAATYQYLLEYMTSKTSSQYEGVDNPSDIYRYYTEYARVHPRHLDLRKFCTFTSIDTYEEFLPGGNISAEFWTYEAQDVDQTDNSHTVLLARKTDSAAGGVGQGWGRDLLNGWAANFEYSWTKNSYVGQRPTDNDAGEKGPGYPKQFYSWAWTMPSDGWKGLNILSHQKHVTTSGFGQLPTGEVLASMRVPDPATQEPVDLIASVSTSPTLDAKTLTGATRLYPIGVA